MTDARTQALAEAYEAVLKTPGDKVTRFDACSSIRRLIEATPLATATPTEPSDQQIDALLGGDAKPGFDNYACYTRADVRRTVRAVLALTAPQAKVSAAAQAPAKGESVPAADAQRVAVLLDQIVRMYPFERGTQGYNDLHLARRIVCRYAIQGDAELAAPEVPAVRPPMTRIAGVSAEVLERAADATVNTPTQLTGAERRVIAWCMSQMSDLSDVDWRQHGFRQRTFENAKRKL